MNSFNAVDRFIIGLFFITIIALVVKLDMKVTETATIPLQTTCTIQEKDDEK